MLIKAGYAVDGLWHLTFVTSDWGNGVRRPCVVVAEQMPSSKRRKFDQLLHCYRVVTTDVRNKDGTSMFAVVARLLHFYNNICE